MKLHNIVTEQRNEKSLNIDQLSTLDLLKVINEEDRLVPLAVEKALPEIAAMVNKIVKAFQNGGRLVYVGAGTSGRIGILDASEIPPTLNLVNEIHINIPLKLAGYFI